MVDHRQYLTRIVVITVLSVLQCLARQTPTVPVLLMAALATSATRALSKQRPPLRGLQALVKVCVLPCRVFISVRVLS